jgi:hypothetical protein
MSSPPSAQIEPPVFPICGVSLKFDPTRPDIET